MFLCEDLPLLALGSSSFWTWKKKEYTRGASRKNSSWSFLGREAKGVTLSLPTANVTSGGPSFFIFSRTCRWRGMCVCLARVIRLLIQRHRNRERESACACLELESEQRERVLYVCMRMYACLCVCVCVCVNVCIL